MDINEALETLGIPSSQFSSLNSESLKKIYHNLKCKVGNIQDINNLNVVTYSYKNSNTVVKKKPLTMEEIFLTNY